MVVTYENISSEIVNILRKNFINTDEKVDSKTRIFHDLRIYGQDSTDFITKLEENFSIDLSNFLGEEYFPSEGLMPSTVKLFPLAYEKFKELTVEMLAKDIIMKKESSAVIF